MPHHKDLPFLMALLDDDTSAVRQKVIVELQAFGTDLRALTRPYWPGLDGRQRQLLEDILAGIDAQRLKDSWLSWLDQEDFYQALEQAMVSLSELEYGAGASLTCEWLDKLAYQFQNETTAFSSHALMHFLFEEKRLKCVPEHKQDFQHDLLFYIAQHGEGSQTALTCLALLVGKRVGIDLHGIFIRGHFMSMACQDTHLKMYNVHYGGKPLSRSSALYMEEALRRNCTWPSEMRAPVFEIIHQILQQNVALLDHRCDYPQASRYQGYLQELTQELHQRGHMLD
jgi:hypothetical protein